MDRTRIETVRVGVLLAGGQGRRLGREKASLRLGGASLLDRNLSLLRELFPVVALSLRVGQEVDAGAAGVDLLPDRWPGSPLGGIATGLDRYGEPVFVLACDMALPERAAIEQVCEAFTGVDVAIPLVGDNLEPLHAAYGPACLTPMRRLLERGRHRVVEFFPDVRVRTVPFATTRPFFNVNHPEDYEQALRLAAALQDGGSRPAAGGAGPAGADSDAAAAAAGALATAKQPALVAIVGKSDSGKTTFLERLLPELKARGLRVGTVKHDVHGFEIDTPGKDSWRHGRAGADAYVVAGPDKLAYVGRLDGELPLVEIARRFFADMDLVVAEGYKRQAPHRVELFRAGAGHAEPLCRPDETIALVTDAPLAHEHRYALDDAAGVADLLAGRLAELREY